MALKRGGASALLVSAVALLAAAAAVDAFRAGPEPADRAPDDVRPASGDRDAALARRLAAAAGPLRAVGVRGVLTYSDERCRVRAVTLPSLTLNPAPDRPCYTAPGAEGVIDPDVPQPGGVMVARCRTGAVEIWWREGKLAGPEPGCAPAWKPTGALTAVRDGEVVEYVPVPERGRLDARVVLGRDALARAVRRAVSGAPAGAPAAAHPRVEAVAWLSDTRFAAIVHGAGTFGAPEDELLALFEGDRLVRTAPCCWSDLAQLRVSPLRRFVAVRSERGLIVVDRSGRAVPLPRGRATGRALAWSPDERWLAVATGSAVAFLGLEGGVPAAGRPAASIPLRARELAWR